MVSGLVNSATSEKLTEMDWMKNIEICELVSHDQSYLMQPPSFIWTWDRLWKEQRSYMFLCLDRQARDVIKAIKKRLGSKNSNAQLFAVTLLEMLMNNIGEHIHRQVIDTGLLPILVKIVKKKTDFPVREKIFLLLDATQTSLGGASGKFPQYYTAYYDLVSAGVQFPQRSQAIPFNHLTSNLNKNQSPSGELASSGHERVAPQAESQVVAESSVIQKAGTALQVLREVLDAVDAQHPEGAKDECALDLVEQCSFQKQQVMHLAMTSWDEKVISRAIDLNEELHKVLSRHDALLFGRSTSTSNHFNPDEVEEEEEAEQLLRRIRKGKACARPEEEECQIEKPFGLLGSPVLGESLHRPYVRPLSLEPSQELNTFRPAVAIPPPPAKHVEREKFFQENKLNDFVVSGHMRGLSLLSRNASSSHSGSTESSD